jgi:hypothetical protein
MGARRMGRGHFEEKQRQRNGNTRIKQDYLGTEITAMQMWMVWIASLPGETPGKRIDLFSDGQF